MKKEEEEQQQQQQRKDAENENNSNNDNSNNNDDDDEGSHFPISTSDARERIEQVISRYTSNQKTTTTTTGPFEGVLLRDAHFQLISAATTTTTSSSSSSSSPSSPSPSASASSSPPSASASASASSSVQRGGSSDSCRTVFEFVATPGLCSSRGFLQGGATALAMDICTGLTVAPIVRRDFWYYGGMTRSLNVNYLRPVPQGTVVRAESEILQIGRRVALIACKLRAKDGGNLLATAEHHLVVVDGDAPENKFIKKAQLS